MPHINRSEVERVAALARLSLSEEEADRLAAELDSFLGYVEQLSELDTNDIVPTSHPIALATPYRDDHAEPALDPEIAVANAPDPVESAFGVPRVIDAEAEG